ncbi:lectin C-type domain protein [Oesophagostomum dentatum]|uniref:Lectin C-type domain protein n=1 Tax=Oesophagostomum dentatum TaxID=61180 RepID=A0A0B1SBS5_OESDE|nr:lectin C-type domain protein [Oesophagostomum dentatum]
MARLVKTSDIGIITIATSGRSDAQDLLRKIASPQMYFKFSRKEDFVNSILDGLCQVNCYCPPNWKQLVVDNRKYGECYFYTLIDTNWKISSKECQKIRSNSHLVHVNTKEKEDLLKTFAQVKNSYLENSPSINYHIGLQYDDNSGKYKWEGTSEEVSYSKWDTGYPNLSLGKCVKAEVDENMNVLWRNVQCSGAGARAMCQSMACDTDNYCK